MSHLSRNELFRMGFLHVGSNVLISSKASFYNCSKISLGNNVRIDDFCVLSAGTGGISVGNYVHVAVFSSLIGAGRIELSDFSNLSSRVSIFSSSDDYSGSTMTNPMVPNEYKNVNNADVHVGKHVIIGSGSVVLPGVTLEDGVAVGALSLVNKNCKSFGIYGGIPITKIGERETGLLKLEDSLLSELDEFDES